MTPERLQEIRDMVKYTQNIRGADCMGPLIQAIPELLKYVDELEDVCAANEWRDMEDKKE